MLGERLDIWLLLFSYTLWSHVVCRMYVCLSLHLVLLLDDFNTEYIDDEDAVWFLNNSMSLQFELVERCEIKK